MKGGLRTKAIKISILFHRLQGISQPLTSILNDHIWKCRDRTGRGESPWNAGDKRKGGFAFIYQTTTNGFFFFGRIRIDAGGTEWEGDVRAPALFYLFQLFVSLLWRIQTIGERTDRWTITNSCKIKKMLFSCDGSASMSWLMQAACTLQLHYTSVIILLNWHRHLFSLPENSPSMARKSASSIALYMMLKLSLKSVGTQAEASTEGSISTAFTN